MYLHSISAWEVQYHRLSSQQRPSQSMLPPQVRPRPQNSGKLQSRHALSRYSWRPYERGEDDAPRQSIRSQRFLSSKCNPGGPHWEAIKRVLAYLAGTIDCSICYRGTGIANHLVGYFDSNFAGCEDTRRSTFDLIFLLNGGLIS